MLSFCSLSKMSTWVGLKKESTKVCRCADRPGSQDCGVKLTPTVTITPEGQSGLWCFYPPEGKALRNLFGLYLRGSHHMRHSHHSATITVSFCVLALKYVQESDACPLFSAQGIQVQLNVVSHIYSRFLYVEISYSLSLIDQMMIFQLYFARIPQCICLTKQLVRTVFILRGVKKPDVVFRNNSLVLGGVVLPSNSTANLVLQC